MDGNLGDPGHVDRDSHRARWIIGSAGRSGGAGADDPDGLPSSSTRRILTAAKAATDEGLRAYPCQRGTAQLRRRDRRAAGRVHERRVAFSNGNQARAALAGCVRESRSPLSGALRRRSRGARQGGAHLQALVVDRPREHGRPVSARVSASPGRTVCGIARPRRSPSSRCCAPGRRSWPCCVADLAGQQDPEAAATAATLESHPELTAADVSRGASRVRSGQGRRGAAAAARGARPARDGHARRAAGARPSPRAPRPVCGEPRHARTRRGVRRHGPAADGSRTGRVQERRSRRRAGLSCARTIARAGQRRRAFHVRHHLRRAESSGPRRTNRSRRPLRSSPRTHRSTT